MSRKFLFSILTLLLLLSSIMIVGANYYAITYGSSYLDEILYYLNTGLEGADLSAITDFIKSEGVLLLVLFIVLLFPMLQVKRNYIVDFQWNKKTRTFRIFPLVRKWYGALLYTLIVVAGASYYFLHSIEIQAYLEKINKESTFIAEHYVKPSEVLITFPEKKKNLMILYLESMETTMMNRENGGGWAYSVTPELERIALEHTNFSNTTQIGGATPAAGTTWTVAGLVATTAGLPLKVPVTNGSYKGDNLLPGAVTLGDILKEQGYRSTFMFGSHGQYGGRKQYFENHGDYKIFDLNTAIDKGLMTEDESVFWGFEDSKLFEWAKEEVLELANSGQPFNFNLLTVNTHFPDGWLENEEDLFFPTQYENVHAESSRQVGEFIEWVQQQEFYKDTTIILVGDHKSMQSDDYYQGKIVVDDFDRVIYNAIINPDIQPLQEKQRLFSTLDMFPTILASIGAKIEGNRLGLGVNLFSQEQTLFEQYNKPYVDEQLSMRSTFYNKEIIGDDYVELLKVKKEKEELELERKLEKEQKEQE